VEQACSCSSLVTLILKSRKDTTRIHSRITAYKELMVQKSSNLDNKETLMGLFSGSFRGFPGDMRLAAWSAGV